MTQRPFEAWFHIKGLVAASATDWLDCLHRVYTPKNLTMCAARMATQCQTTSFQELTVVAPLLRNVHTCALACASSQETCCMCDA